MAGDADTFARFVDLVSAQLDEQGAHGDELASRLHLSRSQLDRVVKATAGEPAGRFRRRILLERAAYRLVTGDVGVLDVAVEAGYSSHEAFTGAFRRAYGAAPSSWRQRPRALHLHAAKGVHFHPPGGLRLPARTQVTSMNLLVSMTEHHLWLTGEMNRARLGVERCPARCARRAVRRRHRQGPDRALAAVPAGRAARHVKPGGCRPPLRLHRRGPREPRLNA